MVALLDGDRCPQFRLYSAPANILAGVDALWFPIRGGVMVNADAIKTSAGALHTMPVCKERSLTEAIRYLKIAG